MRAIVIEEFGEQPRLRTVPDPVPTEDGVVIAVEATGVCRSDWHTWQGHDPDVTLPHVAGHELAGRISAVGSRVRGWNLGDRVTVPFVCACGVCPQCAAGHQQVCERQFQPGATHWGSFAEQVAIERADSNLVGLPDHLGSATAAALGCRFATAFRAVLRQGQLQAGQWVAVHGCGGAGISAVTIAAAAGANVVAVDLSSDALDHAVDLGATATINGTEIPDTARAVREVTGGGAHVSLDCVGHPDTCAASVSALRTRGTHVQLGLMPPEQGAAAIPMHRVIARELRIVGTHGLQAHEYPDMLRLVTGAGLDLEQLIGRRIGLDDVPEALMAMNDPVPTHSGITVVELDHT
ncbi:alcohol dehydrogenase [Halopolyspora algeriensis]|uniref:Alcohol dehydrogenase n=1 Tax=Halopolyspora algeriensis TaxID=1500506 RepID=A0A368VI58_9ACTN|nr:zinc-dependent alcohol dehydrogenase family protein [Halopolyspora algeriensis]RCW40947.1 alcohol dehydrogenase [Halopolyspora algeriensis]TQM53969.1 alcohol dehydrogenase [Halopolyspora algeriensis]